MEFFRRATFSSLIGAGMAGAFLFNPSNARAATNEEMKPDVADLTHLSLEELYNLEVIQLSVQGTHTHPPGQFMVGYQFMYMDMQDYRDGTKRLSDSDVLGMGPPFYANVHTYMSMEMHMAELMYAPRNDLTLMAMLPYKRMHMGHVRQDGTKFTTGSEGIGDLEVMGVYTFFGDIQKGGHRLLLNAGMSLPTGSTDQKDSVAGTRVKLEYAMQTGSGTYDLLPGLTYLGDAGRWFWGAQSLATVRLGRNGEGYRFGDHYRLTGWAAYAATDWFAPFARVDGRIWGNIRGMDDDLNPVTNPESDPDLQGGKRVDLLLGLNFYAPRGKLKGHRLLIEGGIPVYENLDGPQLGTSWLLNVGWNYSW